MNANEAGGTLDNPIDEHVQLGIRPRFVDAWQPNRVQHRALAGDNEGKGVLACTGNAHDVFTSSCDAAALGHGGGVTIA